MLLYVSPLNSCMRVLQAIICDVQGLPHQLREVDEILVLCALSCSAGINFILQEGGNLGVGFGYCNVAICDCLWIDSFNELRECEKVQYIGILYSRVGPFAGRADIVTDIQWVVMPHEIDCIKGALEIKLRLTPFSQAATVVVRAKSLSL